jgi:hypothetical protein
MGMSVKLSDDLALSARLEAEATDRSITAQIEHWAKLGRAVEAALKHADVLALKRSVTFKREQNLMFHVEHCSRSVSRETANVLCST